MLLVAVTCVGADAVPHPSVILDTVIVVPADVGLSQSFGYAVCMPPQCLFIVCYHGITQFDELSISTSLKAGLILVVRIRMSR